MGVKTIKSSPLNPYMCPQASGSPMKTFKTPLTLFLATSALALATGCTPQKTTTPSDESRVSLSAVGATGQRSLVLMSCDTLGMELFLAAED